METIIAGQDKIILFGNPQTAAKIFEQFEVPLVRQDGKMALGTQVSVASMQEKRKQSITQMEKKQNSTLNPIARPSEYKPMGARKKSVDQDLKQPLQEIKQLPPVITTPSQYVPRGAVKIYPVASPLKNNLNTINNTNGLVSEKKLDLYEPRQSSISMNNHVKLNNIPKSPRFDTTIHTEEKIE